jgi:hypothetical protein
MTVRTSPHPAETDNATNAAVRIFESLVRAYDQADHQAVGPLRAELLRLGWRVLPVPGPWGSR